MALAPPVPVFFSTKQLPKPDSKQLQSVKLKPVVRASVAPKQWEEDETDIYTCLLKKVNSIYRDVHPVQNALVEW